MRQRRSKKHNARTMQLLKCLYGDGVIDDVEKKPKGVKKNNEGVPLEFSEQIRVARWLDQQGVLFTASANGGSRHPLEALKLKRMGVKAGHPDLTIYEARGKFHGLLVEMKRAAGSSIQANQKVWVQELIKRGYHAVFAYGYDDALAKITNYLAIDQR